MVISITTKPTATFNFLHTMKTTADTKGIENLSLIAIVSCACSVLYFMVTTLLA